MNIHQTPEPEYIVIPDEDGNDNRFEILFTFEEDETGRKYMLVVPADEDVDDEEEQEVYAFRYEEDGDDKFTFYPIEEEAEWEMVEEVFNTFMAEPEDFEEDETER